jgi:hypothetical protein
MAAWPQRVLKAPIIKKTIVKFRKIFIFAGFLGRRTVDFHKSSGSRI